MSKRFLINPKRRQIVSFALHRYATECRGCSKTVDLVTFAEASEITGASLDEIVNRAANGMIHVVIRPEALLVCLNSLLATERGQKLPPAAPRNHRASCH